MDISAGLTLIGQALGVVKGLREIEKGFDAAALKAQMAELYSALADVKMALTDARETIFGRDRVIKELQDKIDALTAGDVCPICKEGRMKVTASQPHPIFGQVGVLERTVNCEKCGHKEKHMHDPTGLTRQRGR